MSKVFLLSYDADKTSEFRGQLVAFVDSMKYTKEWSLPFDGTVFIYSDQDSLLELGPAIGRFFDGKAPYHLTPIHWNENFGSLPKPTWEWLEEIKSRMTADAQTH